MAKKVRKKPEEEEAGFEFPTFDEEKFLTKEFELAGALGIAGAFALAAGALSWAATTVGQLSWLVPFFLGVVLVAVSPFVIRRLRARADLYTKGDWAALLAFEFFGWLALWFVLVNVAAIT